MSEPNHVRLNEKIAIEVSLTRAQWMLFLGAVSEGFHFSGEQDFNAKMNRFPWLDAFIRKVLEKLA